ncbi:MAG: HEAT repeat domain-containing protein, partial [Pirellulaceae bacterium]|nr:HEAT repeat domain-containing protein [Pirellulaceae bacterium]
VGPDGRLYFSIGDRGYNVKTPNGTFVDPESGAVFRCELDGSNLEIFASGLRNPQELAFDDWGNLFTGDNNSDSGDKARWVNVLEGGDTGWRMMYQYISDRGPFNREKIWQPFSADTPAYIVPPIDNIADGPSGLTYYPGTGLTEDFRNCFLLVDFRGGPSNSGIRLVKVKPKGAFWEIDRNEKLIWNILATDVDFGPDGALWVCDWVDGWVGEGKGRIYRFFNPETRDTASVKEVQQLLEAGFRDLPVAKLGAALRHQDRRVRSGAQLELAARGESQQFTQLVSDTQAELFPRLHAVWGLAQVARLHASARTANCNTLVKLTTDSDSAVRAAAAQGLGDAGLTPPQAAPVAEALIKLLSDSEPRVRFAAAIASGKLQLSNAFDGLCTMLSDNADADPALRHAGIMGLRGAPDATRLIGLAGHASRSVRVAAVVALRKRQDPGVARFLSDSDIAVQTEAARAIHDVPQLHAALSALAALSAQTGTPDPLLHRALNANFRLGEEVHARAIAAVAADSTRSESMRREALEMLRAWSKPGDLDRVMNRHLPLADRDAQPARTALSDVLASAISGSEELSSLALSVAADLGIREAGANLEKIALDLSRPTPLRVDAVKSLLRLDAKQAAPVIKTLSSDRVGAVRAAALKGLAKADPEAATPLLAEATRSSDRVERQSAWDSLAEVDSPEATRIINAGLQQYIAGELPADVWMNVIEASEGRATAESQAALLAFEKAEAEKDPLAPFRDCLSGGNVKAGEQIFLTRTELSCVRCHKVGNKGGEVGPVLTDIAKTKDSRYLLEAIVNPDAKIAENFETAVILTDDDQVLTGIVRQETAQLVSLMTAEGKLIEIPTESISGRKKGKSSMPGDLLKHVSRRQLRDLVAYLSSLKGA